MLHCTVVTVMWVFYEIHMKNRLLCGSLCFLIALLPPPNLACNVEITYVYEIRWCATTLCHCIKMLLI